MPRIDEQNSAFVSRPIYVRYPEEEIELNDICNFRVEVDFFPEKRSRHKVFFL